MFCTKCGAQNAPGVNFCVHCGNTLTQAPAAASADASGAAAQPAYSTPGYGAQPGYGSPSYAAAGYGMAVSPSQPYAGFGLRFIALIVDAIILMPVQWVLALVFGGFFSLAGLAAGSDAGAAAGALAAMAGAMAVYILLMFTVHFFYSTLLESSKMQATLGKKVVGIKVTDLNGNRISVGRAAGRTLGKFLSSMILCVGYLMAAFTERKQALHDLLAGTLVVKGSA